MTFWNFTHLACSFWSQFAESRKRAQVACTDGLTKLAKLDFLTRYPDFYEKLARHMGVQGAAPLRNVESSMVRFHYGPWDDRYYHVLAYLESRGLLEIDKEGVTFRFGLTSSGTEIASKLADEEAFGSLAAHIKKVKELVGRLTGSRLKDLIYEVFGKEVVERKLGNPSRDDEVLEDCVGISPAQRRRH